MRLWPDLNFLCLSLKCQPGWAPAFRTAARSALMDKMDLRLLKQLMEFFILFFTRNPPPRHAALRSDWLFWVELGSLSSYFLPTLQMHTRKIKFELLKHVGRHIQSAQLQSSSHVLTTQEIQQSVFRSWDVWAGSCQLCWRNSCFEDQQFDIAADRKQDESGAYEG